MSASSHPSLSSAAFITNIAESDFRYSTAAGDVDRSSMISKHRLASEWIVGTDADRWWRSGGDMKDAGFKYERAAIPT
jgi:hypothetical protein